MWSNSLGYAVYVKTISFFALGWGVSGQGTCAMMIELGVVHPVNQYMYNHNIMSWNLIYGSHDLLHIFHQLIIFITITDLPGTVCVDIITEFILTYRQ